MCIRHQPARFARFLILGLMIAASLAANSPAPIDREALVSRHSPTLRAVDYDSPLTVGNGGFAFTADVTGLQSFPEAYHREGIPTETLSRWAWVRDENPAGVTLADANRDFTHPDGSVHGYPTISRSEAGQWLRRNPRIHPLGQVALDWQKPDGSAFAPSDVHDLAQRLDLWRGVVESRYTLDGRAVSVTTACRPDEDTVLIRIESALVADGVLGVRLAFPAGHDLRVNHTPGYDWSRPDAHRSELVDATRIERRVADLTYRVNLSRPAAPVPGAPHTFLVRAEAGRRVLELTVNFARDTRSPPPAISNSSRATGPTFGAPRPPPISPAAPIRSPPGSNGASCFPNT